MPYIGNTAADRFVASKAASVYSGDGSTTAFTLEHAVGSDEDILVSVDGVIQEPSVAYAVSSGTTLTFTAAPSSNSGNNIFVYYLFRTVGTVDHPSTSSLQATTGTFSGVVDADAGITVDNITIDGTEIDLSSGDLTVDVAGDIILDADGGDVTIKDGGTSIGAISNTSSDLSIYSLTGNHKGLRFGNAQIVPTNNAGADSDNTTDLGGTSNRFKDLYLSGGVYLGGTGSANKLDDYEEGTFTPIVASTGTDPTVTYSIQEGNYTKIGNQVTVTGNITFSAYTGNGGSFRLEGIPFSVLTDTNYRAVGSVMLGSVASNLSGDYTSLQLSYNSGTSMQILMNNSVTGGVAETPANSIDAGTIIRYQLSYITAS